jgi:CheY-like chemotaxis protein
MLGEFLHKEKRPKILIIDDEEDICEFTRSILEKTKRFAVWATVSPREGIEIARVVRPDLVLLDIIMSEMDGVEVARTLENSYLTRGSTIVFFSILADEKEVEENRGVIGGHYFIQKSIDKDELIAKLSYILEERNQALSHYPELK